MLALCLLITLATELVLPTFHILDLLIVIIKYESATPIKIKPENLDREKNYRSPISTGECGHFMHLLGIHQFRTTSKLQ